MRFGEEMLYPWYSIVGFRRKDGGYFYPTNDEHNTIRGGCYYIFFHNDSSLLYTVEWGQLSLLLHVFLSLDEGTLICVYVLLASPNGQKQPVLDGLKQPRSVAKKAERKARRGYGTPAGKNSVVGYPVPLDLQSQYHRC